VFSEFLKLGRIPSNSYKIFALLRQKRLVKIRQNGFARKYLAPGKLIEKERYFDDNDNSG